MERCIRHIGGRRNVAADEDGGVDDAGMGAAAVLLIIHVLHRVRHIGAHNFVP